VQLWANKYKIETRRLQMMESWYNLNWKGPLESPGPTPSSQQG